MKVIPNFPYRSQTDNYYNPEGSCNVTSIAMCLLHHGIRGSGQYLQLEDECYARCLNRGWSRHEANGLVRLAESYPGIKDDFIPNAGFDDIRRAIDSGIPCVIHGYFTRFGHIIVVKGYDNHGLIVNDPWGEWYSSGYDTSVSGEGLHYSNGLIARVCSPESERNPRDIWLHKISKL
jgi:uncharacterized protein YvpB